MCDADTRAAAHTIHDHHTNSLVVSACQLPGLQVPWYFGCNTVKDGRLLRPSVLSSATHHAAIRHRV